MYYKANNAITVLRISCQCSRHLSIKWAPAVFLAAGIYFLTTSYFVFMVHLEKKCLCVRQCTPHWSSKRQAGSIRLDLIMCWRDSVKWVRMHWDFTWIIKVLHRGMNIADMLVATGKKNVCEHPILQSPLLVIHVTDCEVYFEFYKI